MRVFPTAWAANVNLSMNGNAGKGSTPRNVGPAFRKNYDLIDWGRKRLQTDESNVRPPVGQRAAIRKCPRCGTVLIVFEGQPLSCACGRGMFYGH